MQIQSAGRKQRALILVIGAERGFCGDFNDRLAGFLATKMAAFDHPFVFIVSSRVQTRGWLIQCIWPR